MKTFSGQILGRDINKSDGVDFTGSQSKVTGSCCIKV